MAFRFGWQYKISFLRNYSVESKLLFFPCILIPLKSGCVSWSDGFCCLSLPFCPTEQSEAAIRYIVSNPSPNLSPAPFIRSPFRVLLSPKPKPRNPRTENSEILLWTSLLQGKVDLFGPWPKINIHQLWTEKYKLFFLSWVRNRKLIQGWEEVSTSIFNKWKIKLLR